MKDDPSPQCPICEMSATHSTPAEISPFLRERSGLPDRVLARSNYCENCDYVFMTPLLSDLELRRLYTDYRGEKYNFQRARSEPSYPLLAQQLSDTDSHFYQRLLAFYDVHNVDRSGLEGLVVDAGDGEGYLGRYVYPYADVVRLLPAGETPGVMLAELMAAADELFIAQRLQQWPRPVAALRRFTRWMRLGSEVFLDVPIQYAGPLSDSFDVERTLARRLEAGPLATLHENVSHYSVRALRQLCHRTNLVPIEFAQADGLLSVRARRADQAAPAQARLRPTRRGGTRRGDLDGDDRALTAVGRTREQPRSEVQRLLAELARQDAELRAIYASKLWRATRWLRALGNAVRRRRSAALPPAPMLDLGARLDLSLSTSDAFVPVGFSGPEAWGRWTDGPVAIFHCSHATGKTRGAIEVWTAMVWSRPEGAQVTVTVSVNGGRRSHVKPEAGKPIVVPLSARLMAQTRLEVALHIANPKRPDEQPTADARRLGVGVATVRLRAADPHRSDWHES